MNIDIKRPLVFFDLETTGTSIIQDQIIQISVAKFMPGKTDPIIKTRTVKPQQPISADASKVHGLTSEDVKDAPMFCSIAKNFYNNFIEGCDLAGQNIKRFDVPLLYEEFARCGIEWDVSKNKLIDTYKLAQIVFPRNLGGMFGAIKGFELADAHDAEADNLATIEVLSAFLNKDTAITITPEKALRNKFIEMTGEKIDANYVLTVEDLDKLSTDTETLDLAGKIAINNGEYVYNFGKHRGKAIRSEVNYANWFIGSDDCPSQTQKLMRKIINNEI